MITSAPNGRPSAIRTKAKNIRLAGVDLIPRGPVQFEMTNIHGRKISMGDPGPDSHPTNSTITQHSWSGGGQVKMANPASDMMRFWWSTLMTEYDHYLTLPPETFTYGTAGDFAICLGDYPFGDGAAMLFQIGTNLVRYNPGILPAESDASLDVVVDMGTFTATGLGTVYTIQNGSNKGKTMLFIPGGTDGLGIWDGTTFTVASGTANVVDLATWDNKLFALTADGEVWWSLTPELIIKVDWTLVNQIPDGSSPRHLVNYVNRSDVDTLYVVTSSAVWGMDFTNSRLVKSYFSYPQHPRQGYGSAHWRAELWTSVGMGAHRYDLSQVIPSGIDRDQGTPPEYRGYVTDIVGSYNDLFFFIRGTEAGAATVLTETKTLDVGGGDDTMWADTRLAATNNLVMAWNGIGYHYRWAGAGLTTGNLAVSQADAHYNLFWGNDGQILRQKLPTTYFNPADPPSADFTWAPEGMFLSPWYDWGWPDQVKVLKRLEFGIKEASSTATIEVWYQLDTEDAPLVPLKTITAPGRVGFSLGLDVGHETMPDGSPCYLGEPHNRFRLVFRFRRGTDATQRPVMDWWSAIGRRVLNPIRTWRFNIDLTRQNMGTYPGSAADFLVGLASQAEAAHFEIWDESYMVEVVALSGPKDTTSQEFSGFMTVHLLEANDVEVKLEPAMSLNGDSP